MKIEPIYNKRDNYSRYRVNGVEDVTKTRRTKVCVVTNEMYEVVVNIRDAYEWMSNGKLIQDAMPNLTPEQREFLISGLTPSEFKEMYKFDDDE